MSDKDKSLAFLKEFKDLLVKYKAEIEVLGDGILNYLINIKFNNSTDELEFYNSINKDIIEHKSFELENDLKIQRDIFRQS